MDDTTRGVVTVRVELPITAGTNSPASSLYHYYNNNMVDYNSLCSTICAVV